MHGLQNLLKKLIQTGAGRNRFVAAIVGLSVAMLLILTSVQIQADFNDLLHSKTNQDSIANFLVLNKILTDQNIGATSLTEAEISNLKEQPFVETVGLLSPATFKASIQSNSERFPFYTDISFESVPGEFIDVTGKDWSWDPGKPLVPVIVPNMFLDFYNFQFSFSQNLPQLTQQVVKMIVFKINLYGPGGTVSLNAHVVGFSDRISSLLVPQEFMNWGNSHFGKNREAKPSRVIIRTRDPGNPQLSQYLKTQGLTADSDKTRFSRYRQIVDLVVAISGITGIIMLAFALLIFSLFIQLTIASCKDEITLLITMGAAPKQLRKFLMMQFFPVNVIIILCAILLIAVIQFYLSRVLANGHMYVNSILSFQTFATGIIVILLIWYINRYFIRKYILLSCR